MLFLNCYHCNLFAQMAKLVVLATEHVCIRMRRGAFWPAEADRERSGSHTAQYVPAQIESGTGALPKVTLTEPYNGNAWNQTRNGGG